jgi:hypothetical protein
MLATEVGEELFTPHLVAGRALQGSLSLCKAGVRKRMTVNCVVFMGASSVAWVQSTGYRTWREAYRGRRLPRGEDRDPGVDEALDRAGRESALNHDFVVDAANRRVPVRPVIPGWPPGREPSR